MEACRGELLAGLHVANAGEALRGVALGGAAPRRRAGDAGARGTGGARGAGGQPAGAAGWAQRACALAPGDEGWLRRAMTLLDEGGDTGGALRLYEAAARRLAAEFDATPSGETLALASRIKDGGRKPPASAWARPPNHRRCRPRR